MNGVLRFVLGLSLAGGATCVLVCVLGLSFRKLVKKSWLLYLWLVVLLRFMIPVPLNIPYVTDGFNALTAIMTPVAPPDMNGTDIIPDNADAVIPGKTEPTLSADTVPGDTISGDALTGDALTSDVPTGDKVPANTADAFTVISEATDVNNGFSILRLLPYLWLTGASALLIWTVTGYTLSLRRLRRGRTLLRYDRIPVYESSQITTPILTGILRPVIYLPAGFPNPELAIRHELTHLRRGDIWLKWLVQLVACTHWFNPLAWLMKRELNRLCELACDSAIVRRLEPAERTGYGRMLLETAHVVTDGSGVLIASLGKDKRFLAERIVEITGAKINTKKAVAVMSLLTAVILSAAVLFGALFSGCTVKSGSSDITPTVSKEQEPEVTMPDFVNIDYRQAQNELQMLSAEKHLYLRIEVQDEPNEEVAMNLVTKTTPAKDMILVSGMTISIFYSSGPETSPPPTETAGSPSVIDTATAAEPPTLPLPSGTAPGFVNDPGLIGTWQLTAVAQNISDFTPGSSYALLYDYALVAYENGWTNEPYMTWSKGFFSYYDNQLSAEYTIREIDGSRYLFTELPYQSDANKLYSVFKWDSEPIQTAYYSDDINLPFVDDSAVLGSWKAVSAVQNISDFDPGNLNENGAEITFLEGGAIKLNPETLPKTGFSWTKGFLINAYSITASVYEIREIDGVAYMFIESKNNGSYRHHGQMQGYSVFRKVTDAAPSPSPSATALT